MGCEVSQAGTGGARPGRCPGAGHRGRARRDLGLRRDSVERASSPAVVAAADSCDYRRRTSLESERDASRHGRHASTAAMLAKLAERGRPSTRISLSDARMVLRRANPETNVPLGIAWQIAQNDQGLTLFPYHERYDLAFIYQLQTYSYQREQRYNEMILSISEPPNDNFYFEVVDLANQLQSVVGVERQLDVPYAKALQRAASEYGSSRCDRFVANAGMVRNGAGAVAYKLRPAGGARKYFSTNRRALKGVDFEPNGGIRRVR